ncbi:surface protease GP63 [Trypanosoma grayi]|uniref:surface protease GP63 n=1 Tax=Trypanosoma grayi TaxID=71804 RepID=UPI0004F4ABD8|nr:surface protease GP63 [Trypanosoma grayi]KEG15516.1 surface protease GP63 [Trypanosoma grayi]
MMRCVLYTVLLLWHASGCLAADSHRCAFDEVRGKSGAVPFAVVREVPQKDQGAWQAYTLSVEKKWAPIRIKVFTEDMEDSLRYCTKAGEMRPNFRGHQVPCQAEDVLTEMKRKALVEHTIPAAVKLHTDRLSVEPVVGSVTVKPFKERTCSFFTIPNGHSTSGVSGADMIMYAAAGPTDGAAAWALTCAVLESKRPFVGVMNIDPRNAPTRRLTVRIIAHEIAHALGFGYDEMMKRGMVTSESNKRWKFNVKVVSSTKTKEMTRKHYNCESAPGMELDNEGGPGTSKSHWKRRNARDELMSPITEAGYYTALTMAAFEDMLFYKANSLVLWKCLIVAPRSSTKFIT